MEEIPPMNCRLFQVLTFLAIIALFIHGQPVVAQSEPHHYRVEAVDREQPEAPATNPPPAKNLYGVYQAFVGSPFASKDTATNSDGTEIWPCFGATSPGNVDCPNVGKPAQLLPPNAAVLGTPSLTWPFANATGVVGCDQSTTTDTKPCGQTNTWYEDDTLDSTDDLTYTIVATQIQGTKMVTLANSGTVDFGANPFGAATGANVVIFGDQGFGTIGVPTGPNNGECSTSFNYPLTAPKNPGGTYVIAAGKTCLNPKPGLVTITATTELGTPTYTKSTSKTACAPVTPPCYLVTYTKKYSVIQKWNIWLK
jgi:hypothetical protein